jgi:hypothetical protein
LKRQKEGEVVDNIMAKSEKVHHDVVLRPEVSKALYNHVIDVFGSTKAKSATIERYIEDGIEKDKALGLNHLNALRKKYDLAMMKRGAKIQVRKEANKANDP